MALNESSCSRYDLDQFPGDDSLSGAVVGKGELGDHLPCRERGSGGGGGGGGGK